MEVTLGILGGPWDGAALGLTAPMGIPPTLWFTKRVPAFVFGLASHPVGISVKQTAKHQDRYRCASIDCDEDTAYGEYYWSPEDSDWSPEELGWSPEDLEFPANECT